jgi:hypothetical protein
MVGVMVTVSMWVSALALPAAAQELSLPDLSPRAEVMQTVGLVEVRVNYSSPGRRERTIWGELVPYDQLWRTGANAATTLETTGDLTIGGAAVPAGKYAVFTIPGKDKWTVILNKDPEQAGTGSYDQKLDQARFEVVPAEGPARERLTFVFADTDDDSTELDLEWAGVRVALPISAGTKEMVDASISEYASGTAGGLARAARYRSEHGDLPGALKLLDASLAIEEGWYNTWLKADVLHQQSDHKTAYKLAQRAQELGNAAGEGFFWKDRVEKALAEWKKK